ncbi:MAG: hypothetical protein ACK4TP_04255 [Hyphomicrobium sp.]|jgi:hypothetical protein
MTKNWVAFVSVLLLSGTVAVADDWAGKMKIVDTDGSGTVSRSEWNASAAKLGLGAATPEFSALDKNNNNSVSAKEWSMADKIASAYSKSCKAAEGSWCPCQNNPDKPECQ